MFTIFCIIITVVGILGVYGMWVFCQEHCHTLFHEVSLMCSVILAALGISFWITVAIYYFKWTI